MGKHEVTQGQWQKIMGSNPAYFKKGYNYPVESVSWDDAQKFIAQLNKKSGKEYRLPTEAEWEYACRANGSGKYCGGDNVNALAWHWNNSDKGTHSVGRKQENAFGLHDMSGNISEWCANWYSKKYYVSSPDNNPIGPVSGAYRVLRGGAWNVVPRYVRSARRFWSDPNFRSINLGFRLVFPGQQIR